MQKLDIRLRPSKVFIGLTLATMIISLCIIYKLPISTTWVRAIIVGLTMRYGWLILRNYALLTGGYSIFKIQHNDDGWFIQDRLRQYPAEICGESTVTGMICILRFLPLGERRKRTSIIFRDSIDQDSYRRLLVLLRTSHALTAERARH